MWHLLFLDVNLLLKSLEGFFMVVNYSLKLISLGLSDPVGFLKLSILRLGILELLVKQILLLLLSVGLEGIVCVGWLLLFNAESAWHWKRGLWGYGGDFACLRTNLILMSSKRRCWLSMRINHLFWGRWDCSVAVKSSVLASISHWLVLIRWVPFIWAILGLPLQLGSLSLTFNSSLNCFAHLLQTSLLSLKFNF